MQDTQKVENSFEIACDLETPNQAKGLSKSFAKKAKSKIAPIQITMVEISDDSAPASKAKQEPAPAAPF